MLTRKKITDRIYVIYGENVEDVPRAFIRFQEFYESRDLKGKLGLSATDIEKWWEGARDADCTDSYYQAWTGFNLPGKVLSDLINTPEFHQQQFNPEETELVNLLTDIPKEDMPYMYFIGMWQGSTDVLDHEIAHALYGTNGAYKIKQIENVGRLPEEVYKNLSAELKQEGYHRDVILDEIQAYLSTYPEVVAERFTSGDFSNYTHPFITTFKKYMPS